MTQLEHGKAMFKFFLDLQGLKFTSLKIQPNHQVKVVRGRGCYLITLKLFYFAWNI